MPVVGRWDASRFEKFRIAGYNRPHLFALIQADPIMAGAHAVNPPHSGNRLLMIVALLLMLAVCGLSGLGYLLLTGHHPTGVTPAPAPEQNKADTPPVFTKFDTIVVNLAGPGGETLQVDLQAELASQDEQARLNDYMPRVRSALIMLLTAKTAAELATPQGKVELKTQIKQLANESIDGHQDEPVKNVAFTSFLIQHAGGD